MFVTTAMILSLGVAPQSVFSCAAIASSPPSRQVLLEMSAASDARLQAMIARIREVGSREGPNSSGPDEIRAIVAEVQPDTDVFAAAFEASLCAQPPIPLTPEAERTIHQLGQNIRGAPTRMRDAALRGTPLEPSFRRPEDSGHTADLPR
jgi:hypothetical protein